MNWEHVTANWEQMKGKLRAKWGKLTDDDLEVIKGEREQLAGRLRERYALDRDKADDEIDTWLRQLH